MPAAVPTAWPVRLDSDAGPTDVPLVVPRAGSPLLRNEAGRYVVQGVLVAVGAVVLGVWWHGTGGPDAVHGRGNGVTSVGRVAGLLAGYLCLVEVFLLARVPWIERAVGLDRLTRWHRTLGTSTILLLAIHVGGIVWGYGLTDRRTVLYETGNIVTTYPAMIRGTVAFGLFVLVGFTSARFARRRLSYELWWALHLTVYAGLLLGYAHQVDNGDDFLLHPVSQHLWRGLYVVVFFAVLWWRLVLPLRRTFAHRFVVGSVVHENDRAVSVWITGDELTRMKAEPGQFVAVRFLARGLWSTAHPYSLSAPVGEAGLRITVADNGDHSGALRRLEPGTRALVEGPYGRFTSRRSRPGAPVLLIGGGAGIAPLRALAEDLVGRRQDVVVVQRARAVADVLLDAEWQVAARRATNTGAALTVHRLVGRREDLGRDPLSQVWLVDLVPDIADRDVWVCGPPAMTDAVVRTCRALGVPARHLHLEEFAL